MNQSEVLHLMFVSGVMGFLAGMCALLIIGVFLDWRDSRKGE